MNTFSIGFGKGNRRIRGNRGSSVILGIIGIIGFFGFISLGVSNVYAKTTAPTKLVYNGHLLDSSGDAVTTEVSVRFSFWKSSDYITGDVTSTGAIDIGASNYGSWNETFTLTPNSDGYFTVDLGTGSALPDFSTLSDAVLTSLHLQVEVKASSSANTSYELLDKNTSNASIDRAPLLSVPFALNANLLDGRDTGTASGSIPVLETGGLLSLGAVPGGTNKDTFTLDSDDSVSSGEISFIFGSALKKKLSYDATNNVFSFNNALRVGGQLTATGGLTASGTIATESGVVVNRENAAKDSVIVFGNSLGQETFKFLNTEHEFELSDDVRITGNLSSSGILAVESNAVVGGTLTVGGLINGVDITTLTSDNDVHLKVSSGAGLNLTVASGDYRLGGTVTAYAGSSNNVIADDDTSYVFFETGGLVTNTTGFPTDHMYIPLATVLTAGGSVSTITDKRVFNSADTERTVTRIFTPEFEGVSYQGDGSNNVGQLVLNHSGGNLMNSYQWSSSRSTLQDYDVLLNFSLPEDFIRWSDNHMTISYKSSSSDAANNKLDIAVFDSADNSVTLTGDSTGLVSTGWTTTAITWSGTPTWTAGSGSLIRLRLSAKSDESMHVGKVKLKYVELLSE
ncbi:MAG: hypothetical protein QF741_04590 [Candidatus Peribacteraceae bacterium]|nr:hypothetical protein [Candidatus Peribacteraceae bacterium]MDP7454784.1 hypothetical protein [Candidatus Peribacteraceae bacterium]MDP7646117.1 hypothetical protein [Candidatus Peribacteraceae bacterium]